MDETQIEKQPDWKIEDLYRQAWSIVKKNKVLWIFAAALGTGSNFNNNINFDKSDSKFFENIFNNFDTNSTTNELSRVLGTATSITGDFLGNLFASVPFWLYVLLIVEVVLAILIGTSMSVIYSSWSLSALLINIKKTIDGGKADIQDASQKAFAYIKPLLYVNVVPGLIIAVISIIVFIILAVTISIVDMPLKIGIGILMFVAALFFIYAIVMLTLTLIWATRLVVMDNLPGKKALSSGYKIAKNKFFATLLLGIVNTILSFVLFIVPTFVLAFLVGGGFAAGYFIENLRIPLVLLGGVLLTTVLLLFTVGSAVLSAFKATVWSLAFSKLKTKFE